MSFSAEPFLFKLIRLKKTNTYDKQYFRIVMYEKKWIPDDEKYKYCPTNKSLTLSANALDHLFENIKKEFHYN